MYKFSFQVEVGVLVSILVTMKDTSKLDEYLESENFSFQADSESKNMSHNKETKIPLTEERLDFLLHLLLDDIHKFI